MGEVPTTPPLFCPFCGECFEGETQCPEHEIPLVRFEELDRVRGRAPVADDEPVEPWSLHWGRGYVAGAAACWIVGFFLPFIELRSGDVLAVFNAFEAATTRALNLWIIPSVTVATVLIAQRRRTPTSMRSARLALVGLSLLVAASVALSLHRMAKGAAARGMELEVGWGAFVLALGVVLGVIAGLRFGAAPRVTPPTYRV